MKNLEFSEEQVKKHIYLYMHVRSVVGREHSLSFIINALINCLFNIKDEKSNEFLTKKQIKKMLHKIVDNISIRIDKSEERCKIKQRMKRFTSK